MRITDAVYRLTAWRMGLHAATVELGKGAVLLSGQSGSGKSTLSATLVLRGHRLLADDISFLALADMRVNPFALPIVLKEGSWAAFPALEKALEGSGIYQRFGRRVRFLTPPADGIARQPATVRQILFPRFAQGASLTAEEIGPVAAISAIWQASCRIGRPLDQEGLQQLGRWLEETPAHLLTYGSSEAAAEWIEERLA